jgi:hypothetical protein
MLSTSCLIKLKLREKCIGALFQGREFLPIAAPSRFPASTKDLKKSIHRGKR